MGNFNNTYNPSEVYSNLGQSVSNNNNNYPENLEENTKARGHHNNNLKSVNPEQFMVIGGHSDKHLNKYIDPYLTTYTKACIVTLDHSLLVKASAVVDTSDNNFDTFCTLCIAIK